MNKFDLIKLLDEYYGFTKYAVTKYKSMNTKQILKYIEENLGLYSNELNNKNLSLVFLKKMLKIEWN
jgi:hypothetical protein